MSNDTIKEFESVKELVLRVLSKNKEARNNDTILYIACCEHLGAKSIKDIKKMNLSIITVHKLRQKIQNQEGLYLPSDNVK